MMADQRKKANIRRLFQDQSKFNNRDQFVQCMNITIKVNQMKLYTKDN
jgi:hypothetical protein